MKGVPYLSSDPFKLWVCSTDYKWVLAAGHIKDAHGMAQASCRCHGVFQKCQSLRGSSRTGELLWQAAFALMKVILT